MFGSVHHYAFRRTITVRLKPGHYVQLENPLKGRKHFDQRGVATGVVEE